MLQTCCATSGNRTMSLNPDSFISEEAALDSFIQKLPSSSENFRDHRALCWLAPSLSPCLNKTLKG